MQRPFIAFALACVLVSCDSPGGPGGGGTPARFDIVSGDLQTATAGTELSAPLVVKVTDSSGKPVPGQVVNFVVTAGGGSVFAGASQTNKQGIAQERWTLGTVAGDTQRVEVRAVSASTGTAQVFATFRAVATAAAPVRLVLPAQVYAPVAGAPLDSVVARVLDRFGNGVPGATVAWTVESGGGTVSPGSAVSGADGFARARWTLAARVDSAQSLRARWDTSSAVLSLTAALPANAAIEKVSGDAQTVPADSSAVPQPLVVRVRTASGQPIRGAQVSFQAPAGTTASPPAAVADAQGLASTRWNAGFAPGGITLIASLAALPAAAVQFMAIHLPGTPASLEFGLASRNPVSPSTRGTGVLVLDRHGYRVPGVTVHWSADVHGSVDPASSISNADGLAGTLWTQSPENAIQTLTAATDGGLSASTSAWVLTRFAITVVSPAEGATVGNLAHVTITVAPTLLAAGYTITSVTAAVGASSAPLALTAPDRYEGDLDLTGVPAGTVELVVTANTGGGPTVQRENIVHAP